MPNLTGGAGPVWAGAARGGCRRCSARGALRKTVVLDEGSVSWRWLCPLQEQHSPVMAPCERSRPEQRAALCQESGGTRGGTRGSGDICGPAGRAAPRPPALLLAPPGSSRQRLVGRGAAGRDVVPRGWSLSAAGGCAPLCAGCGEPWAGPVAARPHSSRAGGLPPG